MLTAMARSICTATGRTSPKASPTICCTTAGSATKLLYARATVADPDNDSLHAGLDLNTTVGALKKQGVSINAVVGDATPALLVVLREADGPSYRVGFKNFWVITRYNHSAMYALAVSELAEAIASSAPPAAAAAPVVASGAAAPAPAPSAPPAPPAKPVPGQP